MSADRPFLVREIEQLDRNTLGIQWTDGHAGRWKLSHLRRNCPCAGCVDEWSGKTLLKADDVNEDIVATAVESVGRYALTIKFTDGHTTGIYSFARLRELCQCDECRAKKKA